MTKINFNHWKNHEYGDPASHYRNKNIAVKNERSQQLFKFTEDGLRKGAKILEIGCNCGRNLEAYFRHDCDVYGVDICKESIDFCKQKFKNFEHNFTSIDVFNNSSYFSRYPEDYFDVAFSMGVLMHMPHSTEKTALIAEILRISKNTFFYELCDNDTLSNSSGVIGYENFHEKGYYLSSEDYRQYSDDVKLSEDIHQNRLRFFYRRK